MPRLAIDRPGQRQMCALALALGVIILTRVAASMPANDVRGRVMGEGPDLALRVTYAQARDLGVVARAPRSPEQEAVLSYIQAHERRPIAATAHETWGGLWWEVVGALGERIGEW